MSLKSFIAALIVPPLMAPAALAQASGGASFKVYTAAVTKAPLAALAAEYEKGTGHKVVAFYDPAGAARQRFVADADAALLITNVRLIRDAESKGELKGGVSVPLGSTGAGVVVPADRKKPDISTVESFKAALLGAARIAVSDPARGATVGTHFMKVVEALGIKEAVAPRLVVSKDGVDTVHLVLAGKADLGVSQSSEIVQGSPDAYAGPFPEQFALKTDFALWHREAIPPAVADFVALLTSPAGRDALSRDGIVPAGR